MVVGVHSAKFDNEKVHDKAWWIGRSSEGGLEKRSPPFQPNIFHVDTVFGGNGQNNRLVPPTSGCPSPIPLGSAIARSMRTPTPKHLTMYPYVHTCHPQIVFLPPVKLQEGNVFTRVCHSVHLGGV